MVVPDEIEQKALMSRAELARWLSELAAGIEAGGAMEIALVGPGISLDLPERFRCELEIEFAPDGDEIDVEIELTWRRSAPWGPT
ncbi:amphi-Trp domain-containing protein [Actinomycetospora endophytica]|uniref:Amphi-Trp domain-containing protein n=1 Tax=Actinomycetospora endophytica TaxID=2291215 RepID=A0ABS8PE38_9PSEU|nr:amphi-Trp domain-containing protein [Actinomycetospora endophytica]MCD2195264.1 amphi-Trp domain-containing protein [Actinomycetospora endophytica]